MDSNSRMSLNDPSEPSSRQDRVARMLVATAGPAPLLIVGATLVPGKFRGILRAVASKFMRSPAGQMLFTCPRSPMKTLLCSFSIFTPMATGLEFGQATR